MKNLTASTLTHLESEELSLATCWKIQPSIGDESGFTDFDQDITVSGLTYISAAGYRATSIQSSSSLSVDNLDVTGLLSAIGITEVELNAGKYDQAQVWIFQVNYSDPTILVPLKYGVLGEVRTTDDFFAEFRSLSQYLSQTIGEIIVADCSADLGDARCKVVLDTIPATGSHEYWRIYDYGDNGGFCQIREIEMRATVGGADQCTGGTATASSDNGFDVAANAFDDTANSWQTSASSGDHWVEYQFASPVVVLEVMLQAAGTPSRMPNKFHIQHSDNGTDWTTSFSYEGQSWSTNGEEQTFVAGIVGTPGVDATGTVTNPTSRYAFTDTSRTEADNYFRYGLLTWTSGNNNGYSMEVKSYTLSGTAFELFEPMPYDIQIGDTYDLYAGCDKQASTCKTKFSNFVNFRGFPNCPTQDRLSKPGGQ